MHGVNHFQIWIQPLWLKLNFHAHGLLFVVEHKFLLSFREGKTHAKIV
jgi:hypothetical protein